MRPGVSVRPVTAPAPRPLRADAARNHERLVRAARAVFQESGTAAASLEEVVRRAGVGVATLYRRFAGLVLDGLRPRRARDPLPG